MSIKVNKKVIKVITLVFVATCIVSWYFYLTRPVSLYDLISKSAIKEIHISTSTSSRITYQLPKELTLDNKKDINAITNILNKYKYSKILKYYNPRVAPSNSADGGINIFITHAKADGFIQQYIFVDSENNVIIRNNTGVNIEYKIKQGDKKIFENLSSWLRLKL